MQAFQNISKYFTLYILNLFGWNWSSYIYLTQIQQWVILLYVS